MANKKKYYAVKKGKSPGIYDSWDKCKAQVDGVPGAVYKGFFSLEEARNFMLAERLSRKSSEAESAGSQLHEGYAAFVDGSYVDGSYSWGMAIYKDGELIHTDKGIGTSQEAAKIRNVAGEVKAAIMAVLWAEAQGLEHIAICHDYNGVAFWALGKWKANNPVTQYYAEFMRTRRKMVSFVKVAGHTGIPGNELADKLAKEALGI